MAKVWVDRDGAGKILTYLANARPGAVEADSDDADVKAFLASGQSASPVERLIVALAAEGIITAAKATAIRDRLRGA